MTLRLAIYRPRSSAPQPASPRNCNAARPLITADLLANVQRLQITAASLADNEAKYSLYCHERRAWLAEFRKNHPQLTDNRPIIIHPAHITATLLL